MRSPSIGQASSATTSGAVRLIEAALAIGMVMMAKKNERLEIISSAERRTCVPSRRVRSMPSPKRGTNAAADTRAHGMAVEGEAKKVLQEKGVAINTVDKDAFRKRVAVQTENFIKQRPESKAFIEQIKSTSV